MLMEDNGKAVKSVVATKAKPTEIQNAINRLYEEHKKALNGISLTDEQRENLIKYFVLATNVIPRENVEEMPIKEENVICKLLLSGAPNLLGATVDGILKSLIVRTKNGFVDTEKTGEYTITLLIEKKS
jgi:hypothetical protein